MFPRFPIICDHLKAPDVFPRATLYSAELRFSR